MREIKVRIYKTMDYFLEICRSGKVIKKTLLILIKGFSLIVRLIRSAVAN